MEATEIRERIKTMKTAENLALLLDSIKREVFGSLRFRITAKMLKHFSSDSIAPKRFRTFHIHKKSGDVRQIKAPCRPLDIILSSVNVLLKAVYEPSDAAMGFVCGRSVLSNAQIHVGQNYVFCIDLKDFFPSIPQARVWKRLQLPPFNFTEDVANVLAGLCCSHDKEVKANVLPQGSPVSPLLTNAVCDKLDRRLKGLARRFRLHYSRYADDITFSGMHNVYREDGEFFKELKHIITGQGFRINESKTRLRNAGERQEVTGLTVNSVVNVSRQYISDLRWILSVWEKKGYACAYACFYPKYKRERGYVRKGEPVMENVIGGKLDYLKMIRGAANPAYRKLAARYAALQELVFIDEETDRTESYVYVQPYTMADFQSLFHTTVSLEVSRRKRLVGRCMIAGREKVLAISKSTQRELCADIEGKSSGDIILSEEVESCFVTLCRNKGKNFWLITRFEPKRSRCLSVQNASLDISWLLNYWESEGFEEAVKRLQLFIKRGFMDSEEPLTTSDAQLFITFFTRNNNLTSVQKKRVDALLARDCVRGVDLQSQLTDASESIDMEDSLVSSGGMSFEDIRKTHKPALTADFLSLFAVPGGFKFLTHDFDPDTDLKMADVIATAQSILDSPEYVYIHNTLRKLINGFVNGPEWVDYLNMAHTSNLSSEEMKVWMDRFPKIHPISSNEYGPEIQMFRNTVRVSKPELPKIISSIIDKDNSLKSLFIETSQLDKADFYTNVLVLAQWIIRPILRDIAQRDPFAKVIISYKRSIWNEYRLCSIRITHMGSEAGLFADVRKKIQTEGGAMFGILKSCKSYCDWTVEANFEGENKRWRILNFANLPETEDIEDNVVGFTHILTFYKK